MAEKIGQSVGFGGLVETMYVEGDDLIVDYKQDSTDAFEHVQRVRNEVDVWGDGMKRDRVHVAYVPLGVVMELFGIGINIYTAPMKEVVAGLQRLNRWDACKLVDKKVA